MRKMKIALKALVGIASLSALCAVTPASATPITDFLDPADTLITFGSIPSCPLESTYTCTTSDLSFDHGISDNGFNVGLDTITSATIAIHLTDQFMTGPNNETYRYEIGAFPQIVICANGNCVSNAGVTDIITLDAASLADLAADGMISVKVSSTSGSFSFADSLLTAQVTEWVPVTESILGINNVPEPSTLFLFGAGLAALGSRFRRRS